MPLNQSKNDRVRLIGESLGDGSQLILQYSESGTVLGTVGPALLHDLKQGKSNVKIKCIYCSNYLSPNSLHHKFPLRTLWASRE